MRRRSFVLGLASTKQQSDQVKAATHGSFSLRERVRVREERSVLPSTSQPNMNLNNQTAAVIGLARAGIPAAKFLLERGARVLGYDSKARDELSPQALELETLGAQIHAGEHEFEGIAAAELIVLSPGLKIHYDPLKSVIEAAEARGAEVIGELELAARFCPCPIIAVTGTKGKSTTVKLITEMLRACGVKAHSAGNTGTPLIEMLPQLTAHSWAVVEVSSFQLEKAPTFKPKIAVLLSLLEDHQDYHPTLEQYWETKLKIFANQDENDYAIFNYDDALTRTTYFYDNRFGFELNDSVFGVSTTGKELEHKPSQVFVKDGNIGIRKHNNKFFSVLPISEIPLCGLHNKANLAAALGAVLFVLGENTFKEKQDQFADAIRNFQTLPPSPRNCRHQKWRDLR